MSYQLHSFYLEYISLYVFYNQKQKALLQCKLLILQQVMGPAPHIPNWKLLLSLNAHLISDREIHHFINSIWYLGFLLGIKLGPGEILLIGGVSTIVIGKGH